MPAPVPVSVPALVPVPMATAAAVVAKAKRARIPPVIVSGREGLDAPHTVPNWKMNLAPLDVDGTLPTTPVRCHQCLAAGHTKRRCPLQYCTLCDMYSHSSKYCYRKTGMPCKAPRIHVHSRKQHTAKWRKKERPQSHEQVFATHAAHAARTAHDHKKPFSGFASSAFTVSRAAAYTAAAMRKRKSLTPPLDGPVDDGLPRTNNLSDAAPIHQPEDDAQHQ
jgi:hypothetical protein